MQRQIQQFIHDYFGIQLDLRIRIFSVMTLISASFCFVIAIINSFAGISSVGILVDIAAAVFCLVLFFLARKPGYMKACHLLFILISFFLLFPYLFFHMGGYHGGIPTFMIFACVFTVFLLEGKTAIIITAMELVLYSGLYIYAFRHPESIVSFASEQGYLTSNLMDMLVVGTALCTTMYIQVKLYKEQQRRVEEQNAVLRQASRAKTQFLANTSHEMRTPLTVISVDIQTATQMLKRKDSPSCEKDVQNLLTDAQAEIMRLSRMTGGMLSLNALADNADKAKLDLSSLLKNTCEMMQLMFARKGNQLTLHAENDLIVFGSADMLSQVLINLLQNANVHTSNGLIEVEAYLKGSLIHIAVKDNGSGISPLLLPHIFDRSTDTDKSAAGLFLCKTIIEYHGGTIHIESKVSEGTTITFTLPVYQGQFSRDASL